MTYALLVVAGLVLLGVAAAAGWYALGRGRGAGGVPRASDRPAPRALPPPPEQDDEVTIIGMTPILIGQGHSEVEWADSEVTDARELGATHTLIHDPAAADDEPSAAFALMLVSAVGMSHQGRRRARNEDRYLVLERHNLFVVADGMGGYVGGQVAAQMAVDTIQVAFDANGFTGNAPPEVPRDGAQLSASFQMANRAIYDRSGREPELQGMGTTLVGARFSPRKERLYVAHIGDSRCYRLRGDRLEQITVDHTLGTMGVVGPTAHQLTRAVGVAPGVDVDLTVAHPIVGDRYLLCSDGLTKMVAPDAIADILRSSREADQAAEALIQRANARGGKDNITVIVVNVTFPPVGAVPHDREEEQREAEEAAEHVEAFRVEAEATVERLMRTRRRSDDDADGA